ncbi:RsfA family transcriptional regulator [Bacillus tianshenii]|nr:RsfA family transcriptional regulator [Bacillus tianshenii]
MKTRQDAWSEKDDKLLAETVLRHIREGSTQLNAFDEVGDVLNRTSAACGFRWNAIVRAEYSKEIARAKKERKQRMRALNLKTQPLYSPPEATLDFSEIARNTEQEVSLDDVIAFLQELKDGQDTNNGEFAEQIERLQAENDTLSKQTEQLEKQILQKEEAFQMIEKDYEALVKIMDRARKMVLFEESEPKANTFKMDRNGNLERVANSSI